VNAEGYLGIHLGKGKATVVCFESISAKAKPLAAFDVNVTQQSEQPGFAEIAQLIAQQCSQRSLKYGHIAVALDSTLYMQHDIHSSFTDKKQLATTVRFDTEEALATDVSEVGIAFRRVSSDETGSKLDVFTSEKKILTDVINSLSANGMDPATIEPDSACLYRFITDCHFDIKKMTDNRLFIALSNKSAFLAGPFSNSPGSIAKQRTFLIAPGQDLTTALQRQLPLTLAQLDSNSTVGMIEVVDTSGSVDTEKLSSFLSIPIESSELSMSDDCNDAVTFTAACGAALSHLEKEHTISFRNDFMPYLGRRRKFETTMKIVSVCLCVALIALGLNLQLRLMNKTKPIRDLRKRFEQEYSTVMRGGKMPGKSSIALSKLKTTRNKLKNTRPGELTGVDQKTIPAKLTTVLAAFNSVAMKTNLNIEKIAITSKNIVVSGDTSSRANTLALLKQIKKTMNVQGERLGPKDNRDTFNITLVPKSR